MFDTHCHLNFQAFDGRVEEVIKNAQSVGVNQIVIPGTDLPTSEKAVSIAEKFAGVYAAVGIHPHHVFKVFQINQKTADRKSESVISHQSSDLSEIERLLSNPKVVAIGEIGIDRHVYEKTKHKDYKVDEEFVDLQKEFFIEQVKLAHKYKKSLIIHNREAKKDVLDILTDLTEGSTRGSTPTNLTDYCSVFHCCEPDPELLEFAKEHKMFIGVDGDIVYYKEKQEFIKIVPLEMLVLETDSPYLSPTRQFPNEPRNIPQIAEFVAKLKGISVDKVARQTTENARRLFKVKNVL